MIAAVIVLGYVYAFYIAFIATMGIFRAWPTLGPIARALTLPVALLAFTMDITFNVFIASLILLDLPREATFTNRLNRYQAQPMGWRTQVAGWVCRNLLDPFDAGGHCR